jgi:F420-dependent NADP oxidoreductase-like protein
MLGDFAMKIAIVGAGNVGKALGSKLSSKHEILYAVRDPAKAAGTSGHGAKVVPLSAAASADVLIVTTPYEAAVPALKACGNLNGKIVIDATNPLTRSPTGLSLSLGFDRSAAEEIAHQVPGIRLYKAFNQTGFANMGIPSGTRRSRSCSWPAMRQPVRRRCSASSPTPALQPSMPARSSVRVSSSRWRCCGTASPSAGWAAISRSPSSSRNSSVGR